LKGAAAEFTCCSDTIIIIIIINIINIIIIIMLCPRITLILTIFVGQAIM